MRGTANGGKRRDFFRSPYLQSHFACAANDYAVTDPRVGGRMKKEGMVAKQVECVAGLVPKMERGVGAAPRLTENRLK